MKLRLPFRKEKTTASLVDTTGSLAPSTMAGLGNPRCFGSTVAITLNYLSGVLGEDCYAEGAS